MRTIFCFCFFVTNLCFSELYIICPNLDPSNNVVRYGDYLCRDRLGNNLRNLIPAYLLAKKYNATLVRMPFDVSIYKKMNNQVKHISLNDFIKIKEFTLVTEEMLPNLDLKSSNYLLEVRGKRFYYTDLNRDLKKELKKILFFGEEKARIKKKPNLTYIGIHIRTGENFDLPLFSKQFFSKSDISKSRLPRPRGAYLDVIRPQKAPPLQYYIDAIKYFTKKISSDVIFVLFTDASKPEKLAQILKKHTQVENTITPISNIKDIKSDYCELLGLVEMDGLILPIESTFSSFPLHIGDYKYVIRPKKHIWKNNCLVMKHIELIVDNRRKTVFELY